MTQTSKLRKDDSVEVMIGKEKGKQGKIVRLDSKKGRAIIAGLNLVKKAQKKRKQTDRGGIVEIEAPLHISNLQIVCRKCGATRISISIIEGSKKRVCRKCGEEL